MPTAIALLSLTLTIMVVSYFKARREQNIGEKKEKLKQSEKALSNVQKAKNSHSRLSPSDLVRLRERYRRV